MMQVLLALFEFEYTEEVSEDCLQLFYFWFFLARRIRIDIASSSTMFSHRDAKHHPVLSNNTFRRECVEEKKGENPRRYKGAQTITIL